METKKCVRCGKEKPIDTFPRMKKWTGSYCLDCRREYSRNYYQAKIRVEKEPVEKPKRADYQAEYYKAHKKEIQERKRKLYYQRKEEKEMLANG